MRGPEDKYIALSIALPVLAMLLIGFLPTRDLKNGFVFVAILVLLLPVPFLLHKAKQAAFSEQTAPTKKPKKLSKAAVIAEAEYRRQLRTKAYILQVIGFVLLYAGWHIIRHTNKFWYYVVGAVLLLAGTIAEGTSIGFLKVVRDEA